VFNINFWGEIMRSAMLLTAVLGVALSAQSALGETLTDEEILERFLIQRDAYTAVKTGSGKTRGLTIVSVDDTAPAPDATAVADATTEGETSPGGTIVVGDAPDQPTGSTGDDGSVTIAEGTTDPVGGTDAPDVVLASTPDAPIDAGQVGILPEELQVNVRITFDYDSATIKPDQQPVLEQMCRVIKASDIMLFRIMGHTDSAGSDEYNENLSLLRAEEVKRRLVADCGIDQFRLEAMGLGERFLYDTQNPASGDNRRVEFQALS